MLTREQIEVQMTSLETTFSKELGIHWLRLLKGWLDADAALRAQLAAITQNYESAVHGRNEFRTALTEARQQLTASEARVQKLDGREIGYLSELADYGKTVENLRLRIRTVDAEHEQLSVDRKAMLEKYYALDKIQLQARVTALEEALKFSKEFLNQFAHGVDPENLVVNITIGDIEFAESVEQAIDNALATAPVKKAIIEYGN